jgi:hypothetical protein
MGKWFAREKRAIRLWSVLDAVARSVPEHGPAPRPLGLDAKQGMVYMDFVGGRDLQTVLTQDPSLATAALARLAATTLATFHDTPVDGGKVGSLDYELGSLRRHVPEYAGASDAAADVAGLIDALEAAAGRLGAPAEPSLVHTGWRPNALMVDGAHATMVDLDGWAEGDPAMDAGSFVAEVWRLASTPGLAAVAPLADQFREAYVSLRPSDALSERINLYEAYSLIRLALRRLHSESRAKDRSAKTLSAADMLARAAERLSAI